MEAPREVHARGRFTGGHARMSARRASCGRTAREAADSGRPTRPASLAPLFGHRRSGIADRASPIGLRRRRGPGRPTHGRRCASVVLTRSSRFACRRARPVREIGAGRIGTLTELVAGPHLRLAGSSYGGPMSPALAGRVSRSVRPATRMAGGACGRPGEAAWLASQAGLPRGVP